MPPVSQGSSPRRANRQQHPPDPLDRIDRAEPVPTYESEAWRVYEVIGDCVRAGNDFRVCLDSILRAAMAITSAKMGSLLQLDREAGVLKILAHHGIDASILEGFESLSLEESSKCGLPVRSGKRTVVEDVALSDVVNMPGLAGALLHAGIRAFQSTPLVSTSGTLVGVISTYFAHPHLPAARELKLLDLLARQTADYMERVQAERELEYRTGLAEALLEKAPWGICLVDASFSVRHANPAAMQIFGEASPLTGRNFEELMRTVWNREYADAILHKCRRTLQSGGQGNIPEERASRAGRRELEYYEWRMHRIGLPNGEDGIVCYFRDISNRVRAQAKIHDQEERLRRVVKLAAAGQIASSLAHEINNPLTAVTNALYLLGEHASLGPAAKELVLTATAELTRVSRIVKQSLSYYRSGAVVSELDLTSVLEERLSVFAEKFAAAGITVQKRTIPTARLTGFAEEIRQVMDNLLINALEAMPMGGQLTVSVTMSRTWSNHNQVGIRLTVADTGSGIPRQNIQRIFDAFFTTKSEGGRGLGLWVVRGIVGKHDGTLSIRSCDTKGRNGTVVSIVLPLTIAGHVMPRLGRVVSAA